MSTPLDTSLNILSTAEAAEKSAADLIAKTFAIEGVYQITHGQMPVYLGTISPNNSVSTRYVYIDSGLRRLPKIGGEFYTTTDDTTGAVTVTGSDASSIPTGPPSKYIILLRVRTLVP